MMTYSVARFRGMTHLIISCDEDNHSSKRVINKLGGTHIETILPPKSYVFIMKAYPNKAFIELIFSIIVL